ncbi:hypothetical protein [Acetomicrobium sp.]|uniref:hypothetical protein n=1 Tax=Acetomicrobium sp. TaxID=1872099 RepID=UPI002FCC9027
MFFIAVFCIFSSMNSSEAVTELKLSDHDVCGGLKGEVGQYWFDQVEKETGGKVKIKAYWGGVLFNEEEQLNALSNGLVDIAAIYPDFLSEATCDIWSLLAFPKGA